MPKQHLTKVLISIIIATASSLFVFLNQSISETNTDKLESIFSNFNNSNNQHKSTHEIENYDESRRLFWKKLYNNGGETLYCGIEFGKSYNKGINIEHVYPMSWVTKNLNCGKRKQCRYSSSLFNTIEADLHNLFPASTKINQERSSIAFGNVKGEKREYGNCDFEKSDYPRLVEPRDIVRGDISRAMFYMAKQYELTLFPKQVRILLEWHENDPVSQAEIKRNNMIEKIQGNRNIYIDDPDMIFLDFD